VIVIAALVALPLGWFLLQRVAAYLAFVAVYAYFFTFQSVYLTTAWVRGNPEAAFPADGGPSLSYLGVTLAVYVVGLAMVTVGHELRKRRRSSLPQAV